MTRRRILIGLTGNIATGKSQVAQMLAELGARVIDADAVAHEVMRPAGPAYGAVVEAFGPAILAPDGAIDRSKLGALVFRDPAALRRLELAVHPATIDEVERRIARSSEKVVVVEAIKLIESGMHRDYDALWVVTAPRRLQIARLVDLRGLSEEEAALRVDAQPPQEEKAALADWVIANDGDLEALREKVEAAWAQLRLPARQSPETSRTARAQELGVRRAKREDVPAISALVQGATPFRVRVSDSDVMEWLFSKGLWVAVQGDRLVGVAAWQVENLLSVTDLFCVLPSHLQAGTGSRLLETIEAGAKVLMCEANVVLMPPEMPETVRTFLQRQGYQPSEFQALHRIWREVLGEFVGGEGPTTPDAPILMVKRLRERMVMVPV